MHISRVELENIKSHVSSEFDFECGTIAITGENGAGKTTIIEAIAWVLFDVLDYKKEYFIRRGEKRGSCRVSFISGLDDRLYVVYRDTGASYHVTDPRLGTRIADKKEEVLRFLWQHLGLEPGTDLRSLFKQAIGVPQGTFTSIFLEGAAERKAAFDRLLKVEEYRQAAEKLRETTRFVEGEIVSVRETLARSEGELSRAEAVQNEIAELTAELARAEIESADLQTRIASGTEKVASLDEKELLVTAVRTETDRLSSDVDRLDHRLGQLTRNEHDAAAALEAVTAARPGYEHYQRSVASLSQLEIERHERDRSIREAQRVESNIIRAESERTRVSAELDNIRAARDQIAKLEPRLGEQSTLLERIADLRARQGSAAAAITRATAIEERLAELRITFADVKSQLENARQKGAAAVELPDLERRDSDLVKHLAGLRAGLERDQRFQSEIRNGLCPILSQRCLNLKEGETLESFVSSQFSEIRSHIGELEAEQGSLKTALAGARAAVAFQASVSSIDERLQDLTAEGKRLQSEKGALEQTTAATTEIAAELSRTEAELKALGDPRSESAALEIQIRREPDARRELTEIEARLNKLTAERSKLDDQMSVFAALDARIRDTVAKRDESAEAYRTYLSNQRAAESIDEVRAELADVSAQSQRLRADLEISRTKLNEASAGYDAETHRAERLRLREDERAFQRLAANIDNGRQRVTRLLTEIERFEGLRRSMIEDLREKERLEGVVETTQFIRETLKEAAPRVARNYVFHVSLEANQLFREITGDPERTLKWTEDYSVVLEEGGYERPFVGLSGGEQMAAALSIRLALLKQMTDIRVAFFDEPTTNMDAERRENLAMQIRNITHFDQLFVISHDDTFDNYVDHHVAVGEGVAA